MNPPPVIRQALTGKARLRRGRFGRVVLQVEIEHTSWEPFAPDRRRRKQVGPGECAWEVIPAWYRWRDAAADEVAFGVPFRVPTTQSVIAALAQAAEAG